MGNLAGWSYWKVVSITGQSGAGTDYQVELEIGDSAGGDFHLEGHCTNFPQDIRITDDDGTTLLDHWVEDITSDPIVVHVEVKDDLGSNQDIRIYYGKSGETSASNGANTFIQYHGSTTTSFIDSLVIPYTGYIYESKARITAASHNTNFGTSSSIDAYLADSAHIQVYSVDNHRIINTNNDGSNTQHTEVPTFTVDTFYKLKVINTGSAVTGFVDSNQIGSTDISTNLPNTALGLNMKAYAGTCEQEWSFARKYNSPEPSFSSAGAEQTPAVGAIMNQFQRANIGADLYNGVFA